MRCQLKGPKEFDPGALFARGSIVSFSHSSGKVLPCTTTRWKLGTLYPGWIEATEVQEADPSNVQDAVGERGLSER